MYLLFVAWLATLVLAVAKPRWAPPATAVTLGATGIWAVIA